MSNTISVSVLCKKFLPSDSESVEEIEVTLNVTLDDLARKHLDQEISDAIEDITCDDCQ